jgi:hypothetical protein
MSDTAGVRLHGVEQLRIARLLEAHGDTIGAILAYREVIRDGLGPAADHARLRVAALARDAGPGDPD